MENYQSIKLDSKEQKLEWTLLVLAFLSVIVIVAGVISQSKSVDNDFLLVPLFFLLGGLFFILYGMNGIAKGKLVDKWTPLVLSAWIKAIMKVFIKRKGNHQAEDWKILLGVVAVFVGLACVTTAVIDIYKFIS